MDQSDSSSRVYQHPRQPGYANPESIHEAEAHQGSNNKVMVSTRSVKVSMYFLSMFTHKISQARNEDESTPGFDEMPEATFPRRYRASIVFDLLSVFSTDFDQRKYQIRCIVSYERRN